MGRSITKKALKRLIWDKTNGICAHCGKPATGKAATIDHFIPISWGGGYDQRNLMPLCKKCNRNRGNVEIDAGEFYRYAPRWSIVDCKAYMAEWMATRRNLDGEMV